MAVTTAHYIGMHRPRFISEYMHVDDPTREIERDEHRERVLTWAQCYNVHTRYYSQDLERRFKGNPLLSNTSTASHSPEPTFNMTFYTIFSVITNPYSQTLSIPFVGTHPVPKWLSETFTSTPSCSLQDAQRWRGRGWLRILCSAKNLPKYHSFQMLVVLILQWLVSFAFCSLVLHLPPNFGWIVTDLITLKQSYKLIMHICYSLSRDAD